MSDDSNTTQKPLDYSERQGSAARWRLVRLILAIALLAAYASAAILFYKECTTKSIEGATLVTTCQPPTVSSATVLVLLLVVLLLLWPEISEVTVFGLSLKRRVDAAEADARKAQDDVTSLRASVQIQQVRIDGLVAATASASANITMNNSWDSEPQWSKDMSVQLEDIANRIDNGKASVVSDTSMSGESVSDADLKLQLLSEYEEFATAMGYNLDRRRIRATQDPEIKRWLYAQREFFEEHRDAVQSVRALRNGIAHAESVDRQDVVEGLRVLAKLRPMLADHYANQDVHPPFGTVQGPAS